MHGTTARVRARLADLDRPIAWLARLLEVNRSTVTRWLADDGEIPEERLADVAKVLGKNRDWLAEPATERAA